MTQPTAPAPAQSFPLFDPSVVDWLITYGIEALLNVLWAGVILVVGFMVAGALGRFVRARAERDERIDKTLSNFFSSFVKWSVRAVVIIAVLAQFGVQTASVVAAFGALALGVGLALQGALSNVAAGVMIVFFRPYKIGDFVELAGVSGSVKDVTLFYTELTTPDNRQIIVPNGQAWGGVITNVSAYDTRRCDFVFSAGYGDDIDKVIGVLRATFEADQRVLADPALFVEVAAHGESSVDYVVRAWCKAGDYWGLHFDMNKQVKIAFDTAGIDIPYPHRVEIEQKA